MTNPPNRADVSSQEQASRNWAEITYGARWMSDSSPRRYQIWRMECRHCDFYIGAYGTLIKKNGEVIYTKGGYLGSGRHMSNNVAEYCGFVDGLRYLVDNREALGVVFKVTIRGDSSLVIKQMRGEWGSHGGLYVPYMEEARALLAKIREFALIELYWIPRTENDECDKLSKAELHKRNIKFRIQPEVPPCQP